MNNATKNRIFQNGGKWKPYLFWQEEFGSKLIVHRRYMEKLLSSPLLKLRNLIILELSALNGFRGGEVLTVRVEDIDFENEVLFVLDSKKHKRIPLPLDPTLGSHLEKYMRDNNLTSGYLLQKFPAGRPSKEPTPLMNIKTIEEIWKRSCKRVGIPIVMKPTIGRAYFACMEHFYYGASAVEVQFLLRHNSLLTTVKYLNMIVDFEDRKNRFLKRRRMAAVDSESKVEEEDLVISQYGD